MTPGPVDHRSSAHHYLLAERFITPRRPLAALEPFRVDSPAGPSCAGRAESPTPTLSSARREDLVRRGHVARRERDLRCRWSASGVVLTSPGLGSFRVAADGRSIRWRAAGSTVDELAAEAVLGPPLVLALALQGVFCLHASALAVGDAEGERIVAFLGDSGAGKSTLAATIAALSSGGLNAWRDVRLAADDILPWWPGPDLALPRFPQLKYPTDQQPSLRLPERLPFAELVLLEPAPPDGRVVDTRLSRHQGALALLRHSVASTLFHKSLLGRHFDACSALAATVPMRRLRVPRRPEALVEVFERLEDGPPG
ncbi:MAG: hypothetical protein AAGC60_00420 [Acidobacteriota bacterium]